MFRCYTLWSLFRAASTWLYLWSSVRSISGIRSINQCLKPWRRKNTKKKSSNPLILQYRTVGAMESSNQKFNVVLLPNRYYVLVVIFMLYINCVNGVKRKTSKFLSITSRILCELTTFFTYLIVSHAKQEATTCSKEMAALTFLKWRTYFIWKSRFD